MILYNVKTEVSLNAFKILKGTFDGIIAHRVETDRFFVKLMLPKYSQHVQSVINTYPL
jgi:hypothetical protein